MLNDFRHLGFNQDESGRKVFDGLMQWVAAGDGINMNYRWSQTGRTERNRQDHLYLEGLFPFANQTTFDPISGQTDGRYKKCEATNTCPLAIEFYSSNEYWVKPASLFHTDPMGKQDLKDHPLARLYLLSSKQHGGAGNPASKGNCQQFLNPLDSAPVQRALWEELDQWSTTGKKPPDSEVPTFHGGTRLCHRCRRRGGIPEHSRRDVHRIEDHPISPRTTARISMRPAFRRSIRPSSPRRTRTIRPTVRSTRPSCRRTESDGNEIAGIRLPELDGSAGDVHRLGAAFGSAGERWMRRFGAVHPVREDQGRAPSVRRSAQSVEERYPSFGEYGSAVMRAIDGLVKDRLLLCEDTDAMESRLIQAGLDAGVPPPHGNQLTHHKIPHC